MNKKYNIKHFFSGILLFLLLACPSAFAKKQQMGYGVEKPVKQILLQTHASDGTYRYEYTLTDHLGSVRAVFTEDGPDADNQPDILASRAYMPGGMLMPGTLDETGVHYRFGYQGQFAEEDDETGYNQFMARLYDPRIGRWLIPDAAKQYWNPYLAMGNNWMNGIDADGNYCIKLKE